MNDSEIDSLIDLDEQQQKLRSIVRLTTSSWSDNRGIHVRKDIVNLKRKSSPGYDLLDEEFNNAGPDSLPINLYEVNDGIYEVILVNGQRDWETGYIDDWETRLVEYKV